MKPVVAINSFPTDSDEEVKYVIDRCAELGVKAVVSDGFAKGGEGTVEFAKAVVELIEGGGNHFKNYTTGHYLLKKNKHYCKRNLWCRWSGIFIHSKITIEDD